MCERFVSVLASVWSQGMTRRPEASCTPTPGPVAYHVHFASLTALVISTGFAHVAPSSVLFVTQTERVPLLVPARISFSVSLPRLCVNSSQIVPVDRSTTGQGLPTVLAPSAATTWTLPQVLPPSVLRRRSVAISPESPRPFLRPSQKASRVPLGVAKCDGMR